jgi:hypothetical protein
MLTANIDKLLQTSVPMPRRLLSGIAEAALHMLVASTSTNFGMLHAEIAD